MVNMKCVPLCSLQDEALKELEATAKAMASGGKREGLN